MYRRNISQNILDALSDTPVLLINGSRQVGKSTLVTSLLEEDYAYFTMDDPSILASIKKDPLLFLENLKSPAIIDEVQRAPELFLPLKKVVDASRPPGYFVLTGSANVLSLPKLADSLAGRMEIHTLWPLSQGEILNRQEDFINTLFNADFPQLKVNFSLDDLLNLILQGGYPEILNRPNPNRQKQWFSSYITTILEKDIRDLSNIEGLLELPSLLNLFASRCATLMNASEVSRTAGLATTTFKRYFTLLEKTFLLVVVPAWSKNLSKRLVKAPKIYLNDTGLLTSLLDYNKDRLIAHKTFLGHVLENFVVMELKKQMTWSKQRCQMYHYRSHSNYEVDILLEAPDSRIAAIEVKLANQVSAKDFSGIERLEEDIGALFHHGIVLYMGDKILPFGRNKFAVPLPYLWS